jgi:outer membrane lipoprotein-sorting protein
MRYYQFLSIALVVMSSITIVSAQDFKQTMLEIKRKYEAAQDMRIHMTVDVFSSRETEDPSYHEQVFIAKKGTAFHYRLSTTDMIMNDNYIVVVDHLSHKIILNKRDLQGEAGFYKNAHVNLDSMFKHYEAGRYESIGPDVDKFTVTQKTGLIEDIEIYIDRKSGHLQQVNYLYRTGQWVTISFDEFDLAPVFDLKEFDEQQFVRKTGKSWQPASTLTGYGVIKADDANDVFNN